MIAIMRLAAISAAVIAMLAAPAAAQTPPAAASDTDSYKPPARYTQPTTPKARAPAASSKAAPASTAAAPGAKTIGLISLIGDMFTVKKVGFMVFGNELENVPVPAWKIDDRVATVAARVLAKNFKIKRIQAPAAAFHALHERTYMFNEREEAQVKFLAQYTAGQNCDYYLLISAGGSPLSNTNQYLSGLGVVRWDHSFFPAEYIHALSTLTVYDTKMEKIRWELGSIGQETFMATIKGPHQELKDGSKLPPEAKAAAADPRAQKIAWDLLEQSLTKTLPTLFAAN